MDKPIYTQEAMNNVIRQLVEEKRSLEAENKRMREALEKEKVVRMKYQDKVYAILNSYMEVV